MLKKRGGKRPLKEVYGNTEKETHEEMQLP